MIIPRNGTFLGGAQNGESKPLGVALQAPESPTAVLCVYPPTERCGAHHHRSFFPLFANDLLQLWPIKAKLPGAPSHLEPLQAKVFSAPPISIPTEHPILPSPPGVPDIGQAHPWPLQSSQVESMLLPKEITQPPKSYWKACTWAHFFHSLPSEAKSVRGTPVPAPAHCPLWWPPLYLEW